MGSTLVSHREFRLQSMNAFDYWPVASLIVILGAPPARYDPFDATRWLLSFFVHTCFGALTFLA